MPLQGSFRKEAAWLATQHVSSQHPEQECFCGQWCVSMEFGRAREREHKVM